MKSRFTKSTGFLTASAVAVFCVCALVLPVFERGAPRARVLIFGDLMLDRAVRQDIDAYGAQYPFEKIEPLLAGHDIVAANAEGVFGERPSVASFTNLMFTFETSTLPLLRQLGFTTLSQANNHALNFGWDGLAESKQWMAQNGIGSFGDPQNVDPGPLYQTAQGMTIAFIGYSQWGSDAKVIDAIEGARAKGAFTIVFAHWGEEYATEATSSQITEAHKFIDTGADLVVGAHPHVVEQHEIYKGKAIFYSLGNFIFDQGWNDAVSHGLAVDIALTQSSVTYTLEPFAIEHAQAVPEATTEEVFTLSR